MKTIPLTKGRVALVDDADYEWLSQWKWHAHQGKGGPWYAVRKKPRPRPTPDTLYMHRVVLGVESGVEVDHADGNGLNNQRANLRRATRAQNACNLPPQRRNTSGFKGVSRHGRKWLVQIQREKIGSFDSKEEAARAYNSAAVERFGTFARLNPLEITQ